MLKYILKLEKTSYVILLMFLTYSILILSEIISTDFLIVAYVLMSILSVYYFPLLFIALLREKKLEIKQYRYVKLASCIILMISTMYPAILLITQNHIINSLLPYVVIINGIFFLICLFSKPPLYRMFTVHFIVVVMLMGIQAFS